MANDIQHWTADRVLNESLSSLERANHNQRRTECFLFVSFYWLLSRNGLNRYHDIQQITIVLWNDLVLKEKVTRKQVPLVSM